MPALIVFGDSITYGYADPKGGWVQRIRAYVDEIDRGKNDFTFGVYNLGVDSDNSKYLAERITNEGRARARVWSSGVYTLLSTGINDCIRINKKKAVHRKSYKKNVMSAVEGAKEFSDKVIMFGLTPINEKYTNPVYWDKSISFSNSDLEEYNNIIKEVAKEAQVPFIDIWSDVQKVDWSSLLTDGVHPKEEGHQLLFTVFKRELQLLRIIE